MIRPKITLKEAVKAHWEDETCGTRYSDMERTRYELEPFIKNFADFKSGNGKHVLEIGVGAGVDFFNWIKAGAKVTGIDLTDSAVKNTKERLACNGVSENKYKLLTADAENLPFPDNSFDIVYSWGVLHHTPDTYRAFAEAFRVLKPNGELRAMIYHKTSWTGLMLWVRYALCKGKPWQSEKHIVFKHLESPGTKIYSTTEAKDFLTQIGFTNILITTKLCAGDLLNIKPSKKYQGLAYKIIWALYPRWLISLLGDKFGLDLLIKAFKSS